ncbi:MAG: ferrous iron transport protein B [Bacilli bacterium]|nr:ferrous iron transport protein B [Bacilli bacterium]MDD4282181.1 ferrous iron transport protein B [Bacilli bacterium]MDD4718540.1 ferrous iron transport protein B [Bacilli bacterium]
MDLVKRTTNDIVIALAGNPNVGKSTVFNNLTGLNQHTGNWPGKTVTVTQGSYTYEETKYILVDLPGTYSLMSNSIDEEVARDFICFGNPFVTIVVVDATCLERNLNLVLQTLEITSSVVVCVNLMDEAKRKGIDINLEKLSSELGVPVVGTSANKGIGMKELMKKVQEINLNNDIKSITIKYEDIIEDEIKKVSSELKNIINDKTITNWLTLKLIEGNKSFLESFFKYYNVDLLKQDRLLDIIKRSRNNLLLNGIDQNNLCDKLVSRLIQLSETISNKVVFLKNEDYNYKDRNIDKILTSKLFGIPVMIVLLSLIFYITIIGANYPSSLIANGLFFIEDYLTEFFLWINAPSWVHGILVLGVYRTLAWVVSVMLPPMAIFFPLFTILEDSGYLPRIAFNLDKLFKKSCACGKQALTMCMGFGCNAVGVIGCRIIDSPRERLIAIITNNFVPCNGRFPTLIAVITMFFAGFVATPFRSLVSTLLLTSIIVLGVIMTLFISKVLSKTILKGLPSNFILELPPYRKPQIAKVIIRSIFDRTLFVLSRAVLIAIPAGLLIWVMANINIGNISILTRCANFLDPFATLIGLDGYILMAFILGFPANEIVIPIIIMSYTASSSMVDIGNLAELKTLFVSNGWTWLTAICVMLFSLIHWPCGTTCLTIKKETQSWKWTAISFLVPTIIGIVICFTITTIVRFLGLI